MASALLSGRLALVTGAGSGIGRAVCQALAVQGAKLAAVDVRDKGLESVLSLPGGNHKAFVVDVSNAGSVATLMKDIEKSFSQTPDCAVNCAGITRDAMILKMTENDFDQVLNINLKGTYLVNQAVARSMVEKRIKNGSIVNISSIVAKCGNVGQSNYSASKSGVVGLTKTVAKELARFGIRCNAILPGFVETPMLESIPEKVLEAMVKQVPLGRIGKPSEIADACVFLISDRSSYITGTCLEVSGGIFM